MSNFRLFIAIQLSSKNIEKLFDYQQRKLNRLPFRLISKDFLHLTLVFIGQVNNSCIGQITKSCEKIANNSKPFIIKLENIQYGPSISNPRLVWIEVIDSSQLFNLKTNLEQELIDETDVNLILDNKNFKPHITLARLKKFQLNELPSIEEIEEKLNIEINVNSFSLMESRLTKKGAEYITLAQFPFNNL